MGIGVVGCYGMHASLVPPPLRSQSASYTGAQGAPKCKIGLRRGEYERVGVFAGPVDLMCALGVCALDRLLTCTRTRW